MAALVLVREGISVQTALARSNSDHFADSNSIFRTQSASSSKMANSFWRPKLGVVRMASVSVVNSLAVSQRLLAFSVPPASKVLKP